MAGNQNSGGPRPTAPQYNPANVNGQGGNGQSGQPNPNYTGFAYGQNQALSQQASGAPMQGTEQVSDPKAALEGMLSGLQPLHSPTERPEEHTSHGVDFGRGAGSEVLPKTVVADSRTLENQAIAKQYLPLFMHVAQSPDTPDSFKRFINFLTGTLQ